MSWRHDTLAHIRSCDRCDFHAPAQPGETRATLLRVSLLSSFSFFFLKHRHNDYSLIDTQRLIILFRAILSRRRIWHFKTKFSAELQYKSFLPVIFAQCRSFTCAMVRSKAFIASKINVSAPFGTHARSRRTSSCTYRRLGKQSYRAASQRDKI